MLCEELLLNSVHHTKCNEKRATTILSKELEKKQSQECGELEQLRKRYLQENIAGAEYKAVDSSRAPYKCDVDRMAWANGPGRLQCPSQPPNLDPNPKISKASRSTTLPTQLQIDSHHLTQYFWLNALQNGYNMAAISNPNSHHR